MNWAKWPISIPYKFSMMMDDGTLAVKITGKWYFGIN